MKIKKHFLLSVGSEQTYQHGVRFLAYFFKNKEQILVDLLNISYNPLKSGFGDSQIVSRSTSLEKGKQVLSLARQKMIDMGFAEESIKTDVKAASISTVNDIIAYSSKGLYDALILGRRGLTFLEALIQDSVSGRILDEQCHIPIWICREPQRQKKNVLLCTDGSQQSLNAADHVGFILSSDSEHQITILHVKDSEHIDSEQTINQAISEIAENGFPRQRINTRVIEGKNVSRTIQEFARENNFAVIAMGRKCHSTPATGLSRFFVGSVSSKVLHELHETSLWICK